MTPPELDRLLAQLEPATSDNEALRLRFGLRCARRIAPHRTGYSPPQNPHAHTPTSSRLADCRRSLRRVCGRPSAVAACITRICTRVCVGLGP